MTISLEEHVEGVTEGMDCWWYLTGNERLQVLAAIASIRESERAACEAIFREEAEERGNDCERDLLDRCAARIAARKGKGEATPSTGSHSPTCPQDSDSKRP